MKFDLTYEITTRTDFDLPSPEEFTQYVAEGVILDLTLETDAQGEVDGWQMFATIEGDRYMWATFAHFEVGEHAAHELDAWLRAHYEGLKIRVNCERPSGDLAFVSKFVMNLTWLP